MSNLIARGLDAVRDTNPDLYTALKDIVNGINQVGLVSGAGAKGPVTTPSNVGLLNVAASDGIYDATITDPNPQRGEEYFIEYDTQPSFATARLVKDGGPGRYFRANMGSLGKTYWRYYKQVKGSNASQYVHHGGATATAVPAQTTGGPNPGVPNGSGSSTQGGKGWGPIGPGSSNGA